MIIFIVGQGKKTFIFSDLIKLKEVISQKTAQTID
jgi:hypothetical protein